MEWFCRAYMWATRCLYNELASAYDAVAWLVSFGRWSGWREEALAHVVGESVLEVGFGTGDLLIDMRKRGYCVCGLELSPAMHRVAGAKMRRRKVCVPRVLADARAMPFQSETFDCVVATFPSQYIMSPAALAEAARVLRPATGRGHGGRLVVVGLYLQARILPLRVLGWLASSAPAESVSERFLTLAKAAGLWPVDAGQSGESAVPAVVVEKQCGGSACATSSSER